MNTKKVDMLKGSLWDKIVLFALPIAASSILQQLFNSADVAVVGRFAGTQAVAAVGSNSNVISLIINLFLGISVGSNVIIGNLLGQGNKKTFRMLSILRLRWLYSAERHLFLSAFLLPDQFLR